MLDYKTNDILEKLDVDLTTLRLKCKFFEKTYKYNSIKKKRELRTISKRKNKWNKKIKRRSWK